MGGQHGHNVTTSVALCGVCGSEWATRSGFGRVRRKAAAGLRHAGRSRRAVGQVVQAWMTGWRGIRQSEAPRPGAAKRNDGHSASAVVCGRALHKRNSGELVIGALTCSVAPYCIRAAPPPRLPRQHTSPQTRLSLSPAAISAALTCLPDTRRRSPHFPPTSATHNRLPPHPHPLRVGLSSWRRITWCRPDRRPT